MQNSPGPLSLTDQHPTPHRPRFSPQCPPGSAKSGSLLVGHLTGKAVPSPQLREAAPRLPCDQRGTLNHPGLARGSASQKSRSEVIRLVKYLPPDSPETRGAPARRRGLGSRGRNAGPAAGRQREPRGPGQAPTAGLPAGPASAPEGFGETGAGGRPVRREEKQAGACARRIPRAPGGQSPAGNGRTGDRRRGVGGASPHARHWRARGARSWGRRRGNPPQAPGQPRGAPRNAEQLGGGEAPPEQRPLGMAESG